MPFAFLIVVNLFSLVFDCRFDPPGPALCHNWAFGTQVRAALVELGFAFVYALPLAFLGILSMAVLFLAKMFRPDASRK